MISSSSYIVDEITLSGVWNTGAIETYNAEIYLKAPATGSEDTFSTTEKTSNDGIYYGRLGKYFVWLIPGTTSSKTFVWSKIKANAKWFLLAKDNRLSSANASNTATLTVNATTTYGTNIYEYKVNTEDITHGIVVAKSSITTYSAASNDPISKNPTFYYTSDNPLHASSGATNIRYAIAAPHYTFKEWVIELGDDNYSKYFKTEGNKFWNYFSCPTDVKVTATFTEETKYTIKYDGNGASNVPSSKTVYASDNAITLPDALEIKGRTFTGWKIGNTTYEAGATYKIMSNVTAVAQWKITYTVTIKNDNKNAGTISVYNRTTGNKQTDDESVTISYETTSEVSTNKVLCDVSSSSAAYQYEAKGLLIDGAYKPTYTIDLATFNASYYTGSYTFYWNTKASYSVSVESSHGTVNVSSDYAGPESGKYYLGSVLTFIVIPNAGFSHLGYAKIVNTATNDVSNSTITNNRFTIDGISCNVKVIVEYEAAVYTLSVKAATGHEAAFQTLTITDASGKTISTANYGDAVTFTATMRDGYSLLYWHKAGDDTPLGIADSYTMTVTGDAALEVLATVPCTFDVNYKDGDTGDKDCWLAVTYDVGTSTKTVSKQAADIPFTVDVNVSGKVEYALKFGQFDDSTTWKLDYWEAAGVVLASGASGSVNPTAAISLTAHVANNVTKMLNVYTAWIDASTDTATLKDAKTRDVFTCRELDISQAAVKGATMAGGSLEEDITPTTFIFTGLKYVKLTTLTTIDFSADNVGQNFRYFSMKAPGDDGAQPADADILTYEDNANFLLSQSATTVYAYYGTASQVKISVAYARLSDSMMGTIAIASSTDGDAVIADDGLSATVMQGKTFTAQATAFNGYKFVGWFKLATALGDPDATTARASFVVRSAATFYAKFAKDTNMVCEWEGSATNKALVWKSKTYESSKPFNPAACRVDALGYAAKSLLELTVAMFSAPDAEATATTTLTNIASQDARRLPIRRQERYMQVGVKANVEVDALLVGTSMGGLA